MARERIPVLRLGGTLLVTVQVDLTDGLASTLQSDLLSEITAAPTRGILFDISSLEILDSYLARVLGQTVRMAKLMGARSVITGMQPAVAVTLVELGIPMDEVETALDVDSGWALLGVESGGRTSPEPEIELGEA